MHHEILARYDSVLSTWPGRDPDKNMWTIAALLSWFLKILEKILNAGSLLLLLLLLITSQLGLEEDLGTA